MRVLACALIVLLAGCQSPYLKDGTPNEASPYFEVPADSTLVLQHALTVPMNRKHIYFQYGRAMDFKDVNDRLPYCALALHAQKQVPQTIRADTFVIRKVERQHQFSLARASIEVAQLERRGNGHTWQVLATWLELASDKQPDVVRMVCAAWGLPQDVSHLTVRAIRASLGAIFTLQLAPPNTASTPAPAMRRAPQRPGY